MLLTLAAFLDRWKDTVKAGLPIYLVLYLATSTALEQPAM